MTKNNPRTISFRIALYLLLFYLISYVAYFVFLSGDTFNWLFLAISSILLFVVVYMVVWQSIENLIYKKIRILYKNIHNLKSPKPKIYMDSNWLDRAESEVVKWAEDQKNEMESLKELETYRREFLGNVSHELKTPIFNIQGYVLTLLDGGLQDESINKEYLQRAEKSIDRMINIVNQLDEISKLESNVHELNYEKFDILDLSGDLIEFFEIKAAEKHISIYINPNASAPFHVYADKELIRQVLSNLIENSIKYGNENGRTKISFYDMDEQILIEISDSGIGISQEDIPRIFERFFRATHGRTVNNSGSGLGLAIVKHIIEAHHQTINVRSNMGVGTTFGFTLKKA
jgi:two-component system, OmpR family, phosphate regulon sensor histidine kinase PhoR